MGKNYAYTRYLQVWWRVIKNEVDIVRTTFSCLWETKGQITFMWIVRSAPNSNWSKILWLCSVPTNLIKTQSKKKSLSSGQHFPKSLRPSRARILHANGRKRAKIELFRDFMPFLVICKFDENSIKKVAIVRTTFSPLHVYGRLKGK